MNSRPSLRATVNKPVRRALAAAKRPWLRHRARRRLTAIGAGHDVRLIHGEAEIAAALKRHRADHPVHEFDFSLARLAFRRAQRCAAQVRGPAGDVLAVVPVLVHDGRVLLLNNYIALPEDAMAAVLATLIRRFRPVDIRTQRNYNDYSIFAVKTEMPDGFLATFGDGFDAYVQGLGKLTRRNVRYYHERLRTRFPSLEIEFVAPGELRPELFADFVELMGKRYDNSYWSGFQKADVFAKFRDRVTCTVVRLEGKLAALTIFYVYGDTLVFTGNTFDEAYAKYSLGFLNSFWSFQHAAEQGFVKVLLGPGDYGGYKARLCNATETLYEYSLF